MLCRTVLLSSAGLRVYPISDCGRPMIRIYPRAAERPSVLRQFPQGVALPQPYPLSPLLPIRLYQVELKIRSNHTSYPTDRSDMTQ